MTPEQQKKARNVQRLANKFFEAADAGDEQLYDEYAVELELAVTEVVNDIEARNKRWFIEYRDDLRRYELKEGTAHRGMFNYFEEALRCAHRMEVPDEDIEVLGIEDPRNHFAYQPYPPTREEDQLQRESDERAAFNDRLDNLRNER